MKRFVVLVVLNCVLLLAVSAASVEKIYFGDTGHDKIRRCNLNGSGVEELVTTGLSAVGSIVVDRTGGKMYWTDWTGATIKRADLDGSNVETLVSGLSGPWGIALDTGAGMMYWTEFAGARIRRANLDGTGAVDLVTTGLNHVNGIALDLDNGKMYWADGHTLNGHIERANLDGTSIETVIDGLLSPMEIVLDPANRKMYWADLAADKIQRANTDGTGLEDLVLSTLGTPVGVAIDLAAGKLYFTDSGGTGSLIRRCNLDGTGLEDLITSGIGASYGLTLGPAEAECHDGMMDGPWIGVVSGVEPYDYSIFMIFDGAGTITEMGSFNVPNPAGYYAIASDCSLSGTMWTEGYTPFTGYMETDSTAEMTVSGLTIPILKVRDPGALEGCWTGWFLQDSLMTLENVTLGIDGTGAITAATGLSGQVTGRMYHESGHVAGHILTGMLLHGWQEINVRETVMYNGTEIRGTFSLDCSDCPGGTFSLFRCAATAAEKVVGKGQVVLSPNYPNPFNPRTTIRYTLGQAGHVDLRIFNAAGRVVRTLAVGQKEAGLHREIWNGLDDNGASVASGVYFVRLESSGLIQTRKMILLK